VLGGVVLIKRVTGGKFRFSGDKELSLGAFYTTVLDYSLFWLKKSKVDNC
jgi:hypothetical protein